MLISNNFNQRVINISVPGTCGEWIQTVSNGRECLISLPINRFTKMEISIKTPELGKESQGKLMAKSYEAFQKITRYLRLPVEITERIHFEVQERLEIGKGMASSTADIVAIMAGVASLLEKIIPKDILLKMACEIEPSDGIMFEGLALVDHLNGELIEHFSHDLKTKILMLKPVATYNTQSMRVSSDYAEKLKMKTEEPLNLFKMGLEESSFYKMGKASTLSLLENEGVLEKPYLLDLIEVSRKHSCYGVVGGHSGTVCGLLLNTEETDLEMLIHEIEKTDLGRYYASYEIVETYNKGIVLSVKE